MLETYIISYEKEFISDLIHNIDHNLNNYKILARIYKHSTPHFNNRIDSIIRQHLIKNLELYNKNKKGVFYGYKINNYFVNNGSIQKNDPEGINLVVSFFIF